MPRRGGSGERRTRPQAHQNTFAFKHNKNSRKTRRILASENVGLCAKCHAKVEWRKQYRKYVVRSRPGKCRRCDQLKVRHSYHVVCLDCAEERGICAWCLKSWGEVQRPGEERPSEAESPTAEEKKGIDGSDAQAEDIETEEAKEEEGADAEPWGGDVSCEWEILPGVQMLAQRRRYHAFVLDQWGVLHNGQEAYPDALECVQRLLDDAHYRHDDEVDAHDDVDDEAEEEEEEEDHDHDIAHKAPLIILLSNTSRLAHESLHHIAELGFAADRLHMVTSGEVAHRCMCARSGPFAAFEPGSRCFVLGNGYDDRGYVESSGGHFHVARSVEEADFVLVRGLRYLLHPLSTDGVDGELQEDGESVDSEHTMFERLEAAHFLERCKARSLRLIIANPDYVRPTTFEPLPGRLGELYMAMDGVVDWIGKPHGLVYEAVTDLLRSHCGTSDGDAGASDDPYQVCMVGDSLRHDIAGANRQAGWDSLWILDGVHVPELADAGQSLEGLNDSSGGGGGGGVDSAAAPIEIDTRALDVVVDAQPDESDGVSMRPTFVMPRFAW